MGVIPAHLTTFMERNYQVAEKDEDDLHEQEVDILTMMRTTRQPFRVKTVRIVYYEFLSTSKINVDVKIFGRNFCPKIKTFDFFAFNVCDLPLIMIKRARSCSSYALNVCTVLNYSSNALNSYFPFNSYSMTI